MLTEDYCQYGIEDIVRQLQTNVERGIKKKEAEKRLQEYGPNLIVERKKISPLKIFMEQYKDFMILVLICAALLSLYLGEVYDSLTIIAIVVINGVLGFLQEFRAEKSMEALKKMTAPTARVIRDGKEEEVAASSLVPGDIILLETGDRVPADCRLIQTINLEAEESALTGESIPVKKHGKIIPAKVALGDCKNMLFMGTIVTRGRGKGVVVNTGMGTEMGHIAGMIQESHETQTPLQMRLSQLGKVLVFLCLSICILVVTTGILRGESAYQMFLVGISLAVASIPEGLPAIVTVALALGVQRMAKRNALIRKLPAVETLGCATVICSDKTGTLTQNRMTVQELYVDNKSYLLRESNKKVVFQSEHKEVNPANVHALSLALKIGAVCNNSTLPVGEEKKKKNHGFLADIENIVGDPTENALLIAALKGGINLFKEKNVRIYENPFDSERKRMSVVIKGERGVEQSYVKGAPSTILEASNYILLAGQIKPLTYTIKQKIISENERMASKALRVLGLAYRDIEKNGNYEEESEKNLIFVGLVGMMDPPRIEAKKAIRQCKRAGIKPVMITGDHKLTAMAIARELGIACEEDEVLTGQELDKINDGELVRRASYLSVYARVSPKHKLRIVKALKTRNNIVAMTGDGVNDAPAIKEADIGVSMGIQGTDVTKEASAMILRDDNFATIVAAIEEGRAIYDNIRKFIRYLLSCNVGEVLTMFLASLLWLPLPLLPIQILWVNLVTDGLPAMALGIDPPDRNIMSRPPRNARESIFARGLWWKIIWRGTQIGISTVGIFFFALYIEKELTYAQTMVFATLVLSQLIHVFECRSEKYSVWEIPLFSNPFLVIAALSSFGLLLSVIYIPVLQPIFKTMPLVINDWGYVLLASGWPAALKLLPTLLRIKRNGKIVYVKV